MNRFLAMPVTPEARLYLRLGAHRPLQGSKYPARLTALRTRITPAPEGAPACSMQFFSPAPPDCLTGRPGASTHMR